MDYLSVIVHSITECLPVSSSAHHMLLEHLGYVQNISNVTNIALHVGSLIAICLYFYRDIFQLIHGVYLQLIKQKSNEKAQYALYLVVATLPAVVVGLAVKKCDLYGLKSMALTGIISMVFGLLLWWADRKGKTTSKLSLLTGLWVGIGQCLAFLPGASRLGSTLTMARFLGVERAQALRFSFLLSIPTVCGAAVLTFIDMMKSEITIDTHSLFTATFVTACLSYLFLVVLIRYMQRHGFLALMFYRVCFGGVLIYFTF